MEEKGNKNDNVAAEALLSETEIQQKYLQFQALQQQMQQLTEQMELLQQQNAELDISKNALEELGKTALNTEICAPIADGIFLKAAVQDNQKLLINVGSNTVVEKTVSQTLQLLELHQQEIVRRIANMEKILQEMNSQAMKIYEDVERYVQQA